MTKECIIQKLVTIWAKNEFVSKSVRPEMYDSNLLGSDFSFTAIMLLELLICVEEEFCITFYPDEVEEFGFHTINEVAVLVQNVMNRRISIH